MSPRWGRAVYVGSAVEFHARPIPLGSFREAWVFEPHTPALILGSSQVLTTEIESACRAAGYEVGVRRSGGGAVLLIPGEVTWVDLLISRDDPLWHDDIARSMWWVGDAWVAALSGHGIDAMTWRGPMQRTELSRTVCFAGLGPGEVVDGRGRKLVGISQRRTRDGARFQCAMYRTFRPDPLRPLLGISVDDAELLHRTVADSGGIDPLTALLGSLPDAPLT